MATAKRFLLCLLFFTVFCGIAWIRAYQDHRFFYTKFTPPGTTMTAQGKITYGPHPSSYNLKPQKGCVIRNLPKILPQNKIETPKNAIWMVNLDGRFGVTYGYYETQAGDVEILHEKGTTYTMADGSLVELDDLYTSECLAF